MTFNTPAGSAVDVGRLLAARNIAMVGASDRSAWSRGLHRNLRASPGLGRLWLVSPTSASAHGEPTVPSVGAIDGDVDLACLVVGARNVAGALREAGERGIPAAIVIASGFAEAGAEGAERSAELRELAGRYRMTVLGPNTSGMINVADRVWPLATSLSAPLGTGPVVIAAQSGGVATQLLRLSQARGVGVGAIYGVGNELVVGAVDVVRHHLRDDRTKVIALYLEGIRDPQGFVDVACEAAEAGKAIVVMKVGRSERGRDMVASHTGAMVGDDQVTGVAMRQLGVVRVDTLDELIATAGLLAHGPRLHGRRLAVVSGSGATCTMVADRAASAGLDLVDLAAGTKAALAGVLPAGTAVHNPLDATGAVLEDVRVASRAVVALAADPGVDAVLCQSLVADRFPPDLEPAMARKAAAFAEAVAAAARPVVLQTDISTDLAPELRAVLAGAGLYVSRGIDLTVGAMAASAWWTATVPGVRRPARPMAAAPAGAEPALLGQGGTADLLGRHGVPVLPAVLATDVASAVAAARRLGYPVVAKLAAEGVAHKTDIGGVELRLRDDEQVAAAYDRIVAKAEAAVGPDAVAGVLVTPMREGGIELVVSVNDAAPWGTMLTVGIGGIWVELLNDVVSRLLPVSREDVLGMLRALRGRTLLDGGRGGRPADLDRVAEVVLGVVAAATELGPRLHSVELNPLWVDGDRVTTLDALVLLRDASGG